MERHIRGRTGASVSKLCPGTMIFVEDSLRRLAPTGSIGTRCSARAPTPTARRHGMGDFSYGRLTGGNPRPAPLAGAHAGT